MLLEKIDAGKTNRVLTLTAAGGMIAAIAVADWRTSPYVSLGFLYLFPIMLVAGLLPRWALALLSVLCAVLSETFSALDPEGRIIRLIFATVAFAGFGMFVHELLRNRRLAMETQARLRALVETSPAAILIVGRQSLIEMANQAAVELFAPIGSDLKGQSIAGFLPELPNALPSDGPGQFRTSMQCTGYKGDGGHFVAEVWFSTWKENSSLKLAAIVADVTENQTAATVATHPKEEIAPRPVLNTRQTAVLQLIVREGLTNHQIASRLGLSASTVKNVLQQLYSKMGVNSRSQMVRVALEKSRDLL